jgi:hypothetical protein
LPCGKKFKLIEGQEDHMMQIGHYQSHGEAETAKLEYIGYGHSYEMHLAEQETGKEDDTCCCGGSMEKCRP